VLSVPASSKGVCNIRSSLELPCRFTVRRSRHLPCPALASGLEPGLASRVIALYVSETSESLSPASVGFFFFDPFGEVERFPTPPNCLVAERGKGTAPFRIAK
jgi:hypothetical protein